MYHSTFCVRIALLVGITLLLAPHARGQDLTGDMITGSATGSDATNAFAGDTPATVGAGVEFDGSPTTLGSLDVSADFGGTDSRTLTAAFDFTGTTISSGTTVSFSFGDLDFSSGHELSSVTFNGGTCTGCTTDPWGGTSGSLSNTSDSFSFDLGIVLKSALSSASGMGTFTLNTVSTNQPPVADATGTETVFSALQQSVALDGSNSSDPDAGDSIVSYTWNPTGGNQVGPTTSAMSSLDLADSGLTNTQDSTTLNLTVEDSNGGATDDLSPDLLTLTYANAAPQIDSTSSSPAAGGTDVSAKFTDEDLLVDGSLSNFEVLDWQFNSAADGTGTDFGSGSVSNDGSTMMQTVMGFVPETFDEESVFFLLNDLENQGNPLVQEISLATVIPEPATFAMWSLLGLCIGAYLWRSSRKC